MTLYAASSIGDKVKTDLESLGLSKLPVRVTGLYFAEKRECVQLMLGEGAGLTQSDKVREAQPQSGPNLWRIMIAFILPSLGAQLRKLTRL